MAKENILLPAMSDQMTDAELLSWKISAGDKVNKGDILCEISTCLLYTSPSPRDGLLSRMPSSA